MQFVKGPDFPTGALILGRSGILDAYRTGRGSVRMRAVAEIVEERNTTQIVVTEIPYQTAVESIDQQVADATRARRCDRDHGDAGSLVWTTRPVTSSRFARDANANVVLNNLYKHTQLQTSFGIHMLALVDGVPRLVNLAQALTAYIAHQVEVITRRTEDRLRRARERAHIVEGLASGDRHARRGHRNDSGFGRSRPRLART